MGTYDGSHGTSIERARIISDSGWEINKGGKAGSGVYFWVKSAYYLELAKAWYRQLKAQKRIDKDQRCCVILANIKASDKEIIDFEKPHLREAVLKLAIDKNINMDSTKEIASMYDLFITRLESKFGSTYKVLLMKVTTPDMQYISGKYPLKFLGLPLCCVVRDVTCINILKLIEDENE